MSSTLTLRVAHAHEFSALRALLHAAVHQLGSRHYSAAQCAAWAPEQYDAAAWQQRLAANPLKAWIKQPESWSDNPLQAFVDKSQRSVLPGIRC